jgi:hypothetical protein
MQIVRSRYWARYAGAISKVCDTNPFPYCRLSRRIRGVRQQRLDRGGLTTYWKDNCRALLCGSWVSSSSTEQMNITDHWKKRFHHKVRAFTFLWYINIMLPTPWHRYLLTCWYGTQITSWSLQGMRVLRQCKVPLAEMFVTIQCENIRPSKKEMDIAVTMLKLPNVCSYTINHYVYMSLTNRKSSVHLRSLCYLHCTKDVYTPQGSIVICGKQLLA